jgi:hypothetical protein
MSQRFSRLARIAAVAALSLSPALLRADTIWTSSPTGTEGRIIRIEGGILQMQTTTGNMRELRLETITKIKADNDPALTDAEEAFAQQKWEAAAVAYDRALNGAKAEWVKDRAVSRLIIAAGKTQGNFPLAANAFAQLALRDPIGAGDRKPAIPADKAQVAKAIPLVERAFNTRANDLLRGFLGELYIANGQPEKANALLAQAGAGAKNPSLSLLTAKAALAAKNYPGAVTAIEQNRALFTTPDQQLDALYTLAEAKAAQAADAAKKQDAAIAYMRVVAHFNDRQDIRVVEALMKTAMLLEQLGQPTEAAGLYAQVAVDPRAKGSAMATEAQKKADALKNAKPAGAATR